MAKSSFTLSVRIPDDCPFPSATKEKIIKAVEAICTKDLAQPIIKYDNL